MKQTTFIAIVAATLLSVSARLFADTFGSGANQFTIDFVTIGNPGNPADTTGSPNRAGLVPYTYQMGKYEVSRDMVTKANIEGKLGISLHSMNLVAGGPRPDMPATGVTWFEAAKFVNWLNESQGHQRAYNFDGSGNFQIWTSADAWQTGGANLFRHKDAFYFLPSMDEWYKAAYYDASSSTYFNYPTGSDAVPTAVAIGTAAGTAVYNQSVEQGPADITLAGGLSPYGTMGQGGNAWEWEETEFDLVNDSSSSLRGMRGGFLNSSPLILSASVRIVLFATNVDSVIGFRVARIPEPSSMLLAVLGAIGILHWKRLAG